MTRKSIHIRVRNTAERFPPPETLAVSVFRGSLLCHFKCSLCHVVLASFFVVLLVFDSLRPVLHRCLFRPLVFS